MVYSLREKLVNDKYSTRQVLYLSQDSHQELYAFIRTNKFSYSSNALSVSLYFTLRDVLAKTLL